MGFSTLFMGNLADSVDEKALKELFAPVAEVKDIRWHNDKKTGKFKGCGFVDFFSEEAATQASTLNGTYLHGKPIRIDWSVKGPNGGRGKTGGSSGSSRSESNKTTEAQKNTVPNTSSGNYTNQPPVSSSSNVSFGNYNPADQGNTTGSVSGTAASGFSYDGSGTSAYGLYDDDHGQIGSFEEAFGSLDSTSTRNGFDGSAIPNDSGTLVNVSTQQGVAPPFADGKQDPLTGWDHIVAAPDSGTFPEQ